MYTYIGIYLWIILCTLQYTSTSTSKTFFFNFAFAKEGSDTESTDAEIQSTRETKL